MAIDVKIKSKERKQEEITESDLKFPLKIRKTVDGRVFILDHPDIDIAILPEQKKVIAFAKESLGDHVYASQNILFDFLSKRGVIFPESVRGGNVFGSLEAVIPESANQIDPIKLTLLNISKFIENEREHFKLEKEYHKIQKQRLISPEEEDSTELGEVPHSERKGNIHPGARPYNYGGAFGVAYEE